MSCEYCNARKDFNYLNWSLDEEFEGYAVLENKRFALSLKSKTKNPDIAFNFKFCPICGESLTNPKPLTLEELKERDGKPVYCVSLIGDKPKWIILPYNIVKRPQDYHYGDYWMAYDGEPKESE